jgi:hypothetical protein
VSGSFLRQFGAAARPADEQIRNAQFSDQRDAHRNRAALTQ